MQTHKQKVQTEELKRLHEYNQRRPDYERVCVRAKNAIEAMLKRKGVEFASISWRVKSYHSIWEHLSTKRIDSGGFMTTLPDTAGVRVVVWRHGDRASIGRDIHDIFVVHGTKDAALSRTADGYSDDKYRCSLRQNGRMSRDLTDLVFEL